LVEDLQRVPETYLHYTENTTEIYEVRIKPSGDVFRICCFLTKAFGSFDKRFSKENSKNANERN
jgi:hypothetical protein